MPTIEDIKLLLSSLKSCEDQSTDALKILSSKLDIELLGRCDIAFEEQAEGVFIDLSQQNVFLYKNKRDAITYFNGDESDAIWIIESELVYSEGISSDSFFGNLFYSKRFQALLLETGVISYHDTLNKIYVFLSETHGKMEIGYAEKHLEFCNGDYDIEPLYAKISEKLGEAEYRSFFRDNFMNEASNFENYDDKFYLALKKLSAVFDNSNREFELYKNQFSFEKFSSDLHDEKEKYVKRIQDELSEFLSKVNTLPIQFGVYILLVFRFKDEPVPLIGSIVLIVAWSAFSVVSIRTMEKGFESLKLNLGKTFDSIASESGIDSEVLQEDKAEIDKRISGIETIMTWYKGVVIVFSLVFVVFSGWSVFKYYSMPMQPATIEEVKQQEIERVVPQSVSKAEQQALILINTELKASPDPNQEALKKTPKVKVGTSSEVIKDE